MSQISTHSFIPFYPEGDSNDRTGRPTFPLLNLFPQKDHQRSFEPFCSIPPETFARGAGNWLSDHQSLTLELSLKSPEHYEVEERLGNLLSDHQSLNLELSLKSPEHYEVEERLSGCNSFSLKVHVSEERPKSGLIAHVESDSAVSVTLSDSRTISMPGCTSVSTSVRGEERLAAAALTFIPVPLTADAIRKRSDGRGRSGQRSKDSPYKGVSRYKRTSRFEANIWFKKQHYLGAFTSPEIAAGAHDRAAIYFGRSELNFSEAIYAAEINRLKRLSYKEMIRMLRKQSAGQSKLYPTYPR